MNQELIYNLFILALGLILCVTGLAASELTIGTYLYRRDRRLWRRYWGG